eukprot:TRINITY_DN5013_c0_g1_i2.p1 TRINITY_DN5013_c0_g1~~TRINITY_DN5013_c0_g1_i2.p1  ORF type:complete len:230 (+),score=93.03 TRINITY_DN5013_c0_g1_i2:139-828(+)
MGKKMGINTKSQGKKEARAEHANNKAAAAAKHQEEEHWEGVKASESSKRGKKKEEAGASKEEKDARRAEARRLAKEEELSMLDYGKKPTKAKNKGGGSKVTQKELAERRAKKEAKEAQEQEQHATQKLNITTEDDYARMVGQKIDNRSEDIAACGVDEALAAAGEMLSVGEEAAVDKHPERRMKAAFKAYEEEQLPIMRQDYPGLKLSQYRDRIFQQWQKSPENPRNAV